MVNSREIVLFITNGKGHGVPIYEGDKIKVFFSDKGKSYVLYPLKADGQNIDLGRSKERNGAEGRVLYKRFFEQLASMNYLQETDTDTYIVRKNDKVQTENENEIKPPPEKKEPKRLLIRTPIRGLPPSWH